MEQYVNMEMLVYMTISLDYLSRRFWNFHFLKRNMA
jgi:hypothetical protein